MNSRKKRKVHFWFLNYKWWFIEKRKKNSNDFGCFHNAIQNTIAVIIYGYISKFLLSSLIICKIFHSLIELSIEKYTDGFARSDALHYLNKVKMETVEMTGLLNVVVEANKYMNRYASKTCSHNIWEIKRKMDFEDMFFRSHSFSTNSFHWVFAVTVKLVLVGIW